MCCCASQRVANDAKNSDKMTQRGEDEGGEVCVEQHTQRDSSHSKLARLALVVQPLQGEQPDGCVRSNSRCAVGQLLGPVKPSASSVSFQAGGRSHAHHAWCGSGASTKVWYLRVFSQAGCAESDTRK